MVWPKGVSKLDYPVGLMGETSGPLRLMISGLIRAKYIFLNLHGEFSGQILLVAVNQNSAQSYSGRISTSTMTMIPPPPSSIPEPTKERKDAYIASHRDKLYSDHFTIDLVHDLGLPIADATYTVYATLGEYKSNVLTIKTRIKMKNIF